MSKFIYNLEYMMWSLEISTWEEMPGTGKVAQWDKHL